MTAVLYHATAWKFNDPDGVINIFAGLSNTPHVRCTYLAEHHMFRIECQRDFCGQVLIEFIDMCSNYIQEYQDEEPDAFGDLRKVQRLPGTGENAIDDELMQMLMDDEPAEQPLIVIDSSPAEHEDENKPVWKLQDRNIDLEALLPDHVLQDIAQETACVLEKSPKLAGVFISFATEANFKVVTHKLCTLERAWKRSKISAHFIQKEKQPSVQVRLWRLWKVSSKNIHDPEMTSLPNEDRMWLQTLTPTTANMQGLLPRLWLMRQSAQDDKILPVAVPPRRSPNGALLAAWASLKPFSFNEDSKMALNQAPLTSHRSDQSSGNRTAEWVDGLVTIEQQRLEEPVDEQITIGQQRQEERNLEDWAILQPTAAPSTQQKKCSVKHLGFPEGSNTAITADLNGLKIDDEDDLINLSNGMVLSSYRSTCDAAHHAKDCTNKPPLMAKLIDTDDKTPEDQIPSGDSGESKPISQASERSLSRPQTETPVSTSAENSSRRSSKLARSLAARKPFVPRIAYSDQYTQETWEKDAAAVAPEVQRWTLQESRERATGTLADYFVAQSNGADVTTQHVQSRHQEPDDTIEENLQADDEADTRKFFSTSHRKPSKGKGGPKQKVVAQLELPEYLPKSFKPQGSSKAPQTSIRKGAVQKASAQEVSAQHVSVQQASTQQASAQQASTQQASAQQALIRQAPAIQGGHPQVTKLRDLPLCTETLMEILEHARSYKGHLEMEASIGRILLQGANSLDDRDFAKGAIDSDRMQNSISELVSNQAAAIHFSDRLTSSIDDAYQIPAQDMFDQHCETAVWYEIHCEDNQHVPMIVKIREGEDPIIESPANVIGRIFFHFPRRRWDATLAVQAVEKFAHVEEVSKFLKHFSASISENDDEQPLVFDFIAIKELEIRNVLVKRRVSHKYKQNHSIKLHVTEVQVLDIHESTQDSSLKRAVSVKKAEMAKNHRLWYEAKLSVSVGLFAQNMDLKTGDEAKWEPREVLDRRTMCDIQNSIDHLVSRLDGVGNKNKGCSGDNEDLVALLGQVEVKQNDAEFW